MAVSGLALGLIAPFAARAASTGDGGTDSPQAANVTNEQQTTGTYESARILEVRLDTVTSTRTGALRQLYEVEFRGGKLKGQRETLTSDVESNPYQLEPRAGDKVVVFVQQDEGGQANYFLEGFDRRIPLFWLAVLFVLTLVLLAGKQGLKVAFSIFLSVIIIWLVLIPAFLKGMNPVPIAIILAGVLTFLSTGLSTGWNRRSLVTAVGTFGGALAAYVISLWFANWTHLSGLSSEEDRMFFNQNPLLNPQGILFAGIIIAAMGVVEDVAVSIASGVEQVNKANPHLTFKDRFRAGMVVGRDHMSALANTLIFAYVGGSLSTLLLYTQYQGSWLKFFNFDTVTDEVIRSLAGTIGLVFTVPITALLAAWAVKRKPTVNSE